MFKNLQKSMEEVAKFSNHKGYWYKIQDVMITMICGLLSGLETVEDIFEWSREKHVFNFLQKTFGIKKLPKKSHFYNMLTYVNYKKFNEKFEQWILESLQGNLEDEVITIDGKSIVSSVNFSHDKSMLHIASAMIAKSGMIIASRECEKHKFSEITVLREIVKELNVKGALIVADALHTQVETASTIIDAGADYLLVVKDNQSNLKESIDLLSYNKKTDEASTIEKNGGRIETRMAYLSDNIENLYNKEKWKNAVCIGAIHREFEKDGKKSSQWHYYISSKKMTAKDLLHYARQEWRIESMHWLLDVHFKEDKTKIRDLEVQKNLNLLRKITINLVKQYQASQPKHIPVSRILKRNMYNIENLLDFVTHFRKNGELE